MADGNAIGGTASGGATIAINSCRLAKCAYITLRAKFTSRATALKVTASVPPRRYSASAAAMIAARTFICTTLFVCAPDNWLGTLDVRVYFEPCW
ncbi:hypothetical protein GCM10008942_30580 [Rhizomicrobium electricum]|uniref:Uncharacterized protein n=1 Tax=Rhizomicrobium electricum TaxID=480070 RepID=A0ABN1F0Z2_9PROT